MRIEFCGNHLKNGGRLNRGPGSFLLRRPSRLEQPGNGSMFRKNQR